jgi:hypothetical protein
MGTGLGVGVRVALGAVAVAVAGRADWVTAAEYVEPTASFTLTCVGWLGRAACHWQAIESKRRIITDSQVRFMAAALPGDGLISQDHYRSPSRLSQHRKKENMMQPDIFGCITSLETPLYLSAVDRSSTLAPPPICQQ